jgi:hypothetical protein
MVQRGGLVIIVIAGAVMLALLWSIPAHHHQPEVFPTIPARSIGSANGLSTPSPSFPKPVSNHPCRAFLLVGPPKKSHGGYVKTRAICPGQVADLHLSTPAPKATGP